MFVPEVAAPAAFALSELCVVDLLSKSAVNGIRSTPAVIDKPAELASVEPSTKIEP